MCKTFHHPETGILTHCYFQCSALSWVLFSTELAPELIYEGIEDQTAALILPAKARWGNHTKRQALRYSSGYSGLSQSQYLVLCIYIEFASQILLVKRCFSSWMKPPLWLWWLSLIFFVILVTQQWSWSSIEPDESVFFARRCPLVQHQQFRDCYICTIIYIHNRPNFPRLEVCKQEKRQREQSGSNMKVAWQLLRKCCLCRACACTVLRNKPTIIQTPTHRVAKCHG